MNTFFFGSSKQPLFGIYHPPKARKVRETGVVLCYPMGQEYMRAHRAFRQLALLLSKAGFHVFRFDYAGTGDSYGESEEGSVEQWIEDVGTAIEELKETAGVKRVALVGLRLGGAVAAMAAERRTDVDGVVLWDPVVDGKAYVVEMLEGRAAPTASAPVGVLGFPLTARLRDGIERIDLRRTEPPKGSRRFIMASQAAPELDLVRDAAAPRAALELVPLEGRWNEVDNYGSALIPQLQIKGIVGHLSQEAR